MVSASVFSVKAGATASMTFTNDIYTVTLPLTCSYDLVVAPIDGSYSPAVISGVYSKTNKILNAPYMENDELPIDFAAGEYKA